MDESFFLNASLDSSDGGFSERRLPSETPMTPYFLKSMTPSTFEATLRQKDGELASYMSRLVCTLSFSHDQLKGSVTPLFEVISELLFRTSGFFSSFIFGVCVCGFGGSLSWHVCVCVLGVGKGLLFGLSSFFSLERCGNIEVF